MPIKVRQVISKPIYPRLQQDEQHIEGLIINTRYSIEHKRLEVAIILENGTQVILYELNRQGLYDYLLFRPGDNFEADVIPFNKGYRIKQMILSLKSRSLEIERESKAGREFDIIVNKIFPLGD